MNTLSIDEMQHLEGGDGQINCVNGSGPISGAWMYIGYYQTGVSSGYYYQYRNMLTCEIIEVYREATVVTAGY
jgi:hypothetical protein